MQKQVVIHQRQRIEDIESGLAIQRQLPSRDVTL